MHNLPRGGARRVLVEHAARLPGELLEFCPSTALPIGDGARIISLHHRAPHVAPWQRPPLRYVDYIATLLSWRRIARLVSDAAPDVVLAHPCRYLTAPPLLRWLSVPSVYFCHEPRRVDYEPDVARTRRRATSVPYWPLHESERRGDRAAVARATKMVTNSAFTAARIAEAYGREATPLPLGVPDQFVPLSHPADPEHVLSVGALTAAKGHDLVIKAAAHTDRTWPVVIVAPRESPDEAERLLRLAAQSSVTLRIHTGISDTELVSLYQRALATVYLARREPFGLVSIEAQACGSPVIVADEGGLPETVTDGVTGWRVRRDPLAAAARLDLLADPEVRGSMVAAASAHGRGFSWERSAHAMTAALELGARAGAR